MAEVETAPDCTMLQVAETTRYSQPYSPRALTRRLYSLQPKAEVARFELD